MRKVQRLCFASVFSSKILRKSEVPEKIFGCFLLLENPKKSFIHNNAHKINTNSMAELATQEVKLFGKWSFDDVEVRFSEIRAYLCSRVSRKVRDFRYFFLSRMFRRDGERGTSFFCAPNFSRRGEGKSARISMSMKTMRSKTGTVQIRIAR